MLVKRTCTFLVVACMATCLTQVATAFDLNSVTPAPAAQQKPDWAGFYLKSNPGGGFDSIPWTTVGPSNGFSPTDPGRPVNDNFGLSLIHI